MERKMAASEKIKGKKDENRKRASDEEQPCRVEWLPAGRRKKKRRGRTEEGRQEPCKGSDIKKREETEEGRQGNRGWRTRDMQRGVAVTRTKEDMGGERGEEKEWKCRNTEGKEKTRRDRRVTGSLK